MIKCLSHNQLKMIPKNVKNHSNCASGITSPLIHNTDPLPPDTRDNHPLVQPLAILDRKWDTSTLPPSLLVLVQWLGLAPEDTSRKKWDDLQHKFHLEDKVVFPKEGDDRNAEAQSSRPIRMTRKPTYLSDYV